MIEFVISAACVMNLLIGIIIFIALATHQQILKFPTFHRVGLWVASVGMVLQGVDVLFIPHSDHAFWIISNAGYWLIVVCMLYKSTLTIVNDWEDWYQK